ncbi:hypothetical protein ACMA5I_12005 [Paracoccaceae bacterium GXU_MW_L88]
MTDTIQSAGILISLIMSGVGLYWQWQSESENLEILQAPGKSGEFFVTEHGVIQEVEFHIINDQSEPVILQRINFSPNNTFPAPVLINNVRWDGRPIKIESHSVVIANLLARRDFNSLAFAQKASNREKANNPFHDAITLIQPNEISFNKVASELLKDEHGAEHIRQRLFSGIQAQAIQKALFAEGITFSGKYPEVAQDLDDQDMYLTYGGPCLSYLEHTLSVCTSLEVSTTEGNTFHSEYIGFGLRSRELDKIHREINS